MKLSYEQFLELCKPRLFEIGEFSDNLIIWWEYCSYGYVRVITSCDFSGESTMQYEELLPHIKKIYIEREFRGEVWEVEFNEV